MGFIQGAIIRGLYAPFLILTQQPFKSNFMENEKYKRDFFEMLAGRVTKATGSTTAFILALALVIIWGILGPVFHYSDNWQLVINTGTTIITFLMVFLIQKAQNKDSLAIQLKLNELVAANEFASNRLVNIEDMTEEEMKVIQKYYSKLNEMTKNEKTFLQSHSVEEARKLDISTDEFEDLKKEKDEIIKANKEKK